MAKIEVIQIEFWDGTKYIARTDRGDCHEKLYKLALEKRMIFEALSPKERIAVTNNSLKTLGGLSKRTLKTIEEELYDEIKLKE